MHGIPGPIAIKSVALQGDHHVLPARPLRVLVVDGELLIRWSLTAALEEHGHHVAVAADRDAALHALQTEPLDVILLDCHLADATDLELLRIVRRRAPETPVVVGRNVGRDGEELIVTTLEALDPDSIDMSCLLIIGSSQTRLGHGITVWTSRSHPS